MYNPEYFIQNGNVIAQIRDRFLDEKSKLIYDALVQLNITNDFAYLKQAIKLCGHVPDKAIEFHINLKQYKKSGIPLVYYGLGSNAKYNFEFAREGRAAVGPWFFPFVTDIEWDAFSDKNYEMYGGKYEGKPVISPGDIPKDAIIVIGTHKYYTEIKKDLVNSGYSEYRILRCEYSGGRAYDEYQYFDREFMEPAKETSFIDGGCYNCDSIEKFITWNKNYGYDEIISFEPDPYNYRICESRVGELGLQNTVSLINAGLSDKNMKLPFMASGHGGSKFSPDGNAEVNTVTIDSVTAQKNVSFIKLDVEGYEMNALRGARQTIERCRPRIAVCVYHKHEDLIDIPQYIMSLSEEYRFHLRVYSNHYLEIVLYAV